MTGAAGRSDLRTAERFCQATDCDGSLAHRHARARFCSDRCAHRTYYRDKRRPRAAPKVDDEPPLSPYWREYLRRFDRAIRERSEDAWAACHELAPEGSGNPEGPVAEMLDLLRE